MKRWTGSRILTRMLEVVRAEGYRSLWFKILGETVYRRLLLVERLLEEPISRIEPLTPTTVGLLDADDLDAYLAFRPDISHDELARRLAAGDVCFVARQAGRIVAVTWAATGRGWTRYLGCQITLGPDEVYTYDWLTVPAFRKQHVASQLTVACLRYFRERGYRRVIYAMAPEKYNQRRGETRTGFRAYGMLGYVQIGPYRWRFRRGRSRLS